MFANIIVEVMSLMVRKGPMTKEAAARKVSEVGGWKAVDAKKEL